MLATYKVKVVGMADSAWEITDEDSGRKQNVSSSSIFYELPLRDVVETSDGRSRGRGFATEKLTIGKAELYDKYLDLPLPFFAEVDIQKVTTGRKVVEQVVGFRPLEGFKETDKPAVQAVKS